MSRAYEHHLDQLERQQQAPYRLAQLAATAMLARERLSQVRDALSTAPYCGMSKKECQVWADILERTFAEIRALEGSNASAAA